MESKIRFIPSAKRGAPLTADPASPRSSDKWRRSVSAARIRWYKLSIDELIETDGDALKLTELVQARYALEQTEAARQVSEFLETCGNWS